MPRPLCPNCKAVISFADVNVPEGVAACRACETLHPLHEVMSRREVVECADDAPKGCAATREADAIVLRASTRQLGPGIGVLLFGAVFAGVGVFAGFKLIPQALVELGKVMPAWWPWAAGPERANIAWESFLGPLLGGTAFVVIFGAIGVFAMVNGLMHLVGHVEVRIGPGRATMFTGIGSMGRRKRFDPRRAELVYVLVDSSSRSTSYSLRIEADRTLTVGPMLPEKRLMWLSSEMKRALGLSKNSRR